MFSLVCSILIFYMTYKRYIVSGHFDKDTADFYRRNGMLSRDDLLMGLFLRTKDGNSRLLVSEMKVLIFTVICIY